MIRLIIILNIEPLESLNIFVQKNKNPASTRASTCDVIQGVMSSNPTENECGEMTSVTHKPRRPYSWDMGGFLC